jgi:cell division control protein 6
MPFGDLRGGLEMVRRAALLGEAETRREVTTADVIAAYAASRNLRVAQAVASLDARERAVLEAIVAAGLEDEDEQAISGKVYRQLGESMRMSYTAFHERLRKLEFLRLVDLAVARRRGSAQVILVREGVEEVLAPVPAGSSGASLTCAAGVCDDEKCRYEGGGG